MILTKYGPTVVNFSYLIYYLQLNTGQFGDQYKNRDLKIEKVWIQGLTGCNVTVAVVDDGV